MIRTTTKERVTTNPASNQWAPCRIGLWGTFDVESFGDLLLARVLRGELARRLPGAEITLFSPYGADHATRMDGGDTPEPLGPWSPRRAAALAAGLDCVVVAVDDLSRWREASLADAYGVSDGDVAARAPGRFLIGGLGDLEERCPVVWAGAGLSVDATDDEAVALRKGLAGRPYVAVWDEATKRRIEQAGVDVDLAVVPHAAVLAPRVFAPGLLAKRLDYLRVMGWYPHDRPTVVVQADSTLVPDVGRIAPGVAALAAELGGAAVVCAQTDPWRGDGEFAEALSAALDPPGYRLPVLGVEDLTAVLSQASAVVALSEAARAVAASFGRPHAGIGDPAAVEVGEAAALQAEVDASLDTVAAIATEAAAARAHVDGDRVDRADADLAELHATLTALRRANRALGRRMVEERLAFADRVSGAEALIAAHAGVVAAQEAVIGDQRRALEDLQRTLTDMHAAAQIQAGELARVRKVLDESTDFASGLEARVRTAERDLAALQSTRTFRWTRLPRAALEALRRIAR